MRGLDSNKALPDTLNSAVLQVVCAIICPNGSANSRRTVTTGISFQALYCSVPQLPKVVASRPGWGTAAPELLWLNNIVKCAGHVQAVVVLLHLHCSQLEDAPFWTTGLALFRTAPG